MTKGDDRTRKMLVRSALVTSSTIATLIGAQSLALLDSQQIEANLTPTMEPIMSPSPIPGLVSQPTATATNEIVHTAPSITILRRAGETGPVSLPPTQQLSIQPPKPVQLAAPPPVIVQGEAPPPIIIQQASGSSSSGRTQSSR